MTSNSRRISTDNFSHYFLGLDDFMDVFKTNQSTIPHDVIKYTENKYAIDVAVAGLNPDDISVVLDDNQLKVSYRRPTGKENVEYIKRGISKRDFSLEWVLGKGFDVSDVLVKDGILSITIEREKEKYVKEIPLRKE